MLRRILGKLLCAFGRHKYVDAFGRSDSVWPISELIECARCKKVVRTRLPNPPPPPIQPWQIELWEERERLKHMREEDLRQRWAKDPQLQRAALIRITADQDGRPRSDAGELAVIIELGEGIGGPWGSKDIIAFWRNGDHTCLDGLEFEIVVEDLFSAANKEARGV